MDAAVYLRVSTDRQTVENQRRAVEELARARGYEPVVYEESESAAKARPVLDQLLDDVRLGKRQAVVVWALDRLQRSMAGCIDTVLELDRLGVPVLSVREPWLDTSGPVRSLLVAIFGWVAEQERTRLVDRTRAGIQRAREQGTRSGKAIGRPRREVDAARVVELREAGRSWRSIARALKVPVRTLRRVDPTASADNPA